MSPALRHVLLTLAMVSFAASARPADLRREPIVHGDAQAGAAKAAACAACHGPDGIAPAPVFPNLAGQSATYQFIQLRAYKDGSRPNPVMAALVGSLSIQDMKDLSAHFASLHPHTEPSAPTAQPTAAGQTLYLNGDAARGVPACQGCHGERGQGPQSAGDVPARDRTMHHTPWHTFPTLAGQGAPYVVEQLKAYRDGTRLGSTNARIMHGVAQNLDDAQIEAIAAYLATLPH